MPDEKQEGKGMEEKRVVPKKYSPVHVAHGSVVPDGAIRMTQDQVIDMHYRILKNWQPQSDVWPFKYGASIASAFAALTGVAINAHFRRKFALTRYGVVQTYLPVVVFPTLLAAATQIFMKKRVMTDPYCPSCTCIRGGALQSLCCGYSVVLAAPMCIKVSRHYHTYILTKNNFQPTIFHALRTKPLHWYCFLGLIVSNFALGYLITHLQGDALEKIAIKEAKKVVNNLVLR